MTVLEHLNQLLSELKPGWSHQEYTAYIADVLTISGLKGTVKPSKNPALKRLSDLFLDCIKVETGITSQVWVHLQEATIKGGAWTLPGLLPGSTMALVANAFGVRSGDAVRYGQGLNEVLSALLSCRLMAGILDDRQLMELVYSMAGEVPFLLAG